MRGPDCLETDMDQASANRAFRETSVHARARGRALLLLACIVVAFSVLSLQLLRLGLMRAGERAAPRLAASTPVARTYARPDIVDRNGRLLATDLIGYAVIADPSQILDADLAAEALLSIFPDLNAKTLREKLGDKARKFEWIKRGLTPRIAQRAHDLGVPGLALKKEPKRTYPLGRLAGHVLGSVSVDNRGLSGVEKFIDTAGDIEAVVSGQAGFRRQVRLTIDVGVQHGLEEHLALAIATYKARAAAGVVLNVRSGAIAAMASLPDVAPAVPREGQDPGRIDRMMVGRYELGSVVKAFTIAMALDGRHLRLADMVDVRGPLDVDGYKIKDLYSVGPRMSVRDIFLRSSNVGVGRIALKIGPERIKAFFYKIGLTSPVVTEAGPVALARLPKRWGDAETATSGFGHGLALAPLQFAAAAAALVNGGFKVQPTLLQRAKGSSVKRIRVLKRSTSRAMQKLMRQNVTLPIGTGRRAVAKGFEVGGKTGTAEQAKEGRYQKKQVISSFLGAFPMSNPKYLTYVLLFEPSGVAASRNKITAGLNAAPVTAKLVARIAPQLGILPNR